MTWLLTGSAARALAGFGRRPADLDIECAAADAPAAAAALGLVLRPEAGGGARSLRARGAIAGVGVDLSADLALDGSGGRLDPDFTLQRTFAGEARVAGRAVLLAPVEEALARTLVRADRERLDRLLAEAPAGLLLRADYLARRLAPVPATS
ncbi:MAG: hypothetical protein QOK40_1494 [Miltoncostaeaceae bacterium]|nr:hypothetical protein [Miltoncostaeaceae bacterium]